MPPHHALLGVMTASLALAAGCATSPRADPGTATPSPAASPAPVTPAITRADIVGDWRLDSLHVYALRADLPDSTRARLAGHERTIGGAVSQFRSGEISIVSHYRADSTYEFEVTPRGSPEPVQRERGRWSFDPATRALSCRSDTGAPCNQNRATVERATPAELVLRLEMTGKDTGLGEYFRLVRR